MGEAVNHQYDKAFAWELNAHHYVRRHISQGVYYFSGENPPPEIIKCACLSDRIKMTEGKPVAATSTDCDRTNALVGGPDRAEVLHAHSIY